jgi:hypothetical protein
MDVDLEQMSREQLTKEVKKLRQGIRRHRDSSGHELNVTRPLLFLHALAGRPLMRM